MLVQQLIVRVSCPKRAKGSGLRHTRGTSSSKRPWRASLACSCVLPCGTGCWGVG